MHRGIRELNLVLILIASQFAMTVAITSEKTNSQPKYLDLVKQAFDLTSEEIELFEANEFLVLNRMGTDDILDAYKYYWEKDLPVFITTDTMLHVWHLIFDKTLKQTESIIFYPLLRDLVSAMMNTALGNLSIESDWAAQDAAIYCLVAVKLLNSTIKRLLPNNIEEPASIIHEAILNELPLDRAILELQSDPVKRFIDDFSQYKPRGHYTQSEDLQRYFRGFKWFSRIPFFFDEYSGNAFLNTTPFQLVRSAIYLTWLMKVTRVGGIWHGSSGFKIWQAFKGFLDVLIGETYSITLEHLNFACFSQTGALDWNPRNLSMDDFEDIRQAILANDSIPSPRSPFIIDALAMSPTSPKTFVLFGERLTLDTYALNHLVYPYVPDRMLPVGLDFPAAVLNSTRALYYLANVSYEDQIVQMQQELAEWPTEEKQTIFWHWINALKPLVQEKPDFTGLKDPIIPKFMRTEAWLDEKLTTVLSSWTQLKHDTILYAKQGLTGYICSTPEGYVEPYPEAYRALGELCENYMLALLQIEELGLNLQHFFYDWVFPDFINATKMLEGIAIHELQGIPLNESEKSFIRSVYGEATRGCGNEIAAGWLGEIVGQIDGTWESLAEYPNSRVSLVADIHTDLTTRNVLHVATGLFEPIIAIVSGWEGEETAVVGPVFSYYEFILSKEQRMTDEDWRGIIALRIESNPETSPDFMIFPRGLWAQTYMVSTEMTSSLLYYDMEDFKAPSWFQGEESSSKESRSLIYQLNPREGVILSFGLLGIFFATLVVISRWLFIKRCRMVTRRKSIEVIK